MNRDKKEGSERVKGGCGGRVFIVSEGGVVIRGHFTVG